MGGNSGVDTVDDCVVMIVSMMMMELMMTITMMAIVEMMM